MNKDVVGHHYEIIYCPGCEKICTATVAHTDPFWSYVHFCEHCGYTIMESEWNEVKDQLDLNGNVISG